MRSASDEPENAGNIMRSPALKGGKSGAGKLENGAEGRIESGTGDGLG